MKKNRKPSTAAEALLMRLKLNGIDYLFGNAGTDFAPIIEAYANIQHSDMSGSWHQDNGTTTYLLMVSDTLQKGEGCLEIKDKKINFIQNQLIAFPSELSHRGLASNSSLPRISIAFKTHE